MKPPLSKKGESTWYGLLLACKKVGKDKVLEKLEAEHRVWENASASWWAEPSMHYKAHKLDLMLLKQDETMIKLRNMSDEDIDKLLREAKTW